MNTGVTTINLVIFLMYLAEFINFLLKRADLIVFSCFMGFLVYNVIMKNKIFSLQNKPQIFTLNCHLSASSVFEVCQFFAMTLKQSSSMHYFQS